MKDALKAPRFIQKWSAENPEVSATLLKLSEEGVRAGIYCGTAAEIGMRSPMYRIYGKQSKLHAVIDHLANSTDLYDSLPLSLSHEADDIDIIVHDADFPTMVGILGADVDSEIRSFQTTDNYTFEYRLSVARKKVGPKVLEICHPDGPMIARRGMSTVKYDWSITDYAASNFLNFRTRHGLVPLAHPGETRLIYNIIQRNRTENDRHDIEKMKLASWATLDYFKNMNEYYNNRITEIATPENRNRLREFDGRVADFEAEKRHQRDLNRPRGGVWLENWPGL